MKKEPQKNTQAKRENLQSEAALRCKYCGFDTCEDVVKAALWTSGGLVVVEDIPARLCEGCGEQFFGQETTERIRDILTCSTAKAKRRIRVPVYSVSQVRVTKQNRPSEAPDQGHVTSLELTDERAKQGAKPFRKRQDLEATFLCKYCESETVEDLVKSAFWVNGELIAVEHIPARVCPRCKEQFYSDETAEKIATLKKRHFIRGMARRDISAPVFSPADSDESLGKSHHQE